MARMVKVMDGDEVSRYREIRQVEEPLAIYQRSTGMRILKADMVGKGGAPALSCGIPNRWCPLCQWMMEHITGCSAPWFEPGGELVYLPRKSVITRRWPGVWVGTVLPGGRDSWGPLARSECQGFWRPSWLLARCLN